MPDGPDTKGNESHLVSFSYVAFFILLYSFLFPQPLNVFILHHTKLCGKFDLTILLQMDAQMGAHRYQIL